MPGGFYLIEANDKIPDNCKYPLTLIKAAQNQKEKKHRKFSNVGKVKNWCKSNKATHMWLLHAKTTFYCYGVILNGMPKYYGV